MRVIAYVAAMMASAYILSAGNVGANDTLARLAELEQQVAVQTARVNILQMVVDKHSAKLKELEKR